MPSRNARIARVVIVVSALMSVFIASTGIAEASSAVAAMTQVESSNGDMGSGAVEWSGATFNASTGVLLTVDDEHNAYEFTLYADGSIDHSVAPRVIELALGATDFEGVAWISGQKYAFLSEGTGDAIIATVPAAAPNGTTTVTTANIERTFDASPGGYAPNLGPEGIATDGASFYVASEMPPTLTKFDFDGNWIASVDLTELGDASGVAVAADGTFLVASHESRLLAHYSVNWNTETATQIGSRSAGLFTQLEGVAIITNSDVHLFGEDNSRKGQLGQTYAHLTGQVVSAPTYAVADIDCSGSVSMADAMVISQLAVGSRASAPSGCGTGDMNGDGRVDLADALLITRCHVGIANLACP